MASLLYIYKVIYLWVTGVIYSRSAYSVMLWKWKKAPFMSIAPTSQSDHFTFAHPTRTTLANSWITKEAVLVKNCNSAGPYLWRSLLSRIFEYTFWELWKQVKSIIMFSFTGSYRFLLYHSEILVSIDAKKPSRLKLNSVAEHNANPNMIGSNDIFTNIPVFSPNKSYCNVWK